MSSSSSSSSSAASASAVFPPSPQPPPPPPPPLMVVENLPPLHQLAPVAAPASEQLCYVHCHFCDTVLVVSVPTSSLFKTVTVRCGHCSSLLTVNMRSLLFQGTPTTNTAAPPADVASTTTTITTEPPPPPVNNNGQFHFHHHSLNLNPAPHQSLSLLDEISSSANHPSSLQLLEQHGLGGLIPSGRNAAAATAAAKGTKEPSPRTNPVVNRPPEKRQRVPSAYNRFIKDEIQRIKAGNPDISHREAFSAAAKNVSVPTSSLFKTVTVRCGHCSSLLTVNMRSLLFQGTPTTNTAAPPADVASTTTTITTEPPPPPVNNNGQFHFHHHSLNLNPAPHQSLSLLDEISSSANHPSSLQLLEQHGLGGLIPSGRNAAAATAAAKGTKEPSPRTNPVVNRPPEKRQRVPSAYNRFIKDEIQRIKAGNPDISHREAFSAAAKNWAHFPHIHFGLMPDHQGLKKTSLLPHQDHQRKDGLLKDGLYAAAAAAAAAAANMGLAPY